MPRTASGLSVSPRVEIGCGMIVFTTQLLPQFLRLPLTQDHYQLHGTSSRIVRGSGLIFVKTANDRAATSVAKAKRKSAAEIRPTFQDISIFARFQKRVW